MVVTDRCRGYVRARCADIAFYVSSTSACRWPNNVVDPIVIELGGALYAQATQAAVPHQP